MSLTFVAEKPDMGRSIAAARAKQLGVSQQPGSGFVQVGPDTITWLMGHMYELQPPGFYHQKWSSWRIEDLPIIVDNYKRKPGSEDYQVRQLAIVRNILKKAETIVGAGDAGREGQLLIDEMLQEMGYDPFAPNVKRLWLHSLAEKDIIKGFNEMIPNSDKKNLFAAAFERQTADWTHGLSLTRFYTVKANLPQGSKPITIGRVQTPVAKLVYDRDMAIENFKPVKHYRPSGFFKHENGLFKADWVIPKDADFLDPEGYLVDKSVADAVAAKISGKTGKVSEYNASRKKQPAPMPYTLDTLTKACTSKYSMTADEVAKIMQSLYETHKIASYPRTDCEFLPTTILKDDAPAIMAALSGSSSTDKAAGNADLSIRSGAWNDAKVGEHHGIIPTTDFTPAKYSALNSDEKKVFDLIAQRFIAQFYPDKEWNSMNATVIVEGESFRATGRQPVKAGWTAVYDTSEEGEDPDPDEESDQSIPVMKKGDGVLTERTVINDSTTKPPSYYNDGTLMEAMKYVSRFVTNPEIKKRLKDGGLGTSATRGPTIKKLLETGYLKRKGKVGLTSTPMCREVIRVVPESVSSPEMTAIWEQQLSRIERGEASAEQFSAAVRKSVTDLLEKIKGVDIKIRGAIEALPGHGNTCPSCGVGTLMTRQITLKKDGSKKTILACSANNRDDPNACKYVDWGDGPKATVEPLPGHGKTCEKCGKGKMLTRMINSGPNAGQRFLSCDQWSKDNPKSCNHSEGLPERAEKPKPSETMAGDGSTCTKCRKGTMRTRQSKTGKIFLACDNWRPNDKTSCDQVVWGEDKVEPLEGHGVTCTKCNKGLMMTKSSKGGRFLSCNTYPACDNAVFPDSYNSPKKASSGGSFPARTNSAGSPPARPGAAPPSRLVLPPRRK